MKTVSEIATDKLAVSADEVERWIRSEGAKQDQARAHRSGKPVAAASETDAASSKDEEIHDQNEDDDDMWVACDACLKWRRIEKSTWTSHVASQMEASAEAAASTAAAASADASTASTAAAAAAAAATTTTPPLHYCYCYYYG